MRLLQSAVLFAVALALPALALAQQTMRPDPADSRASVPAAVYVSPFERYRPLGDDQVSPWKATNETVGKIGGWKAYAKEAQEPQPATAQPGQPLKQPAPQAKPPASGGHSGHKMN